MKNSRLLRKLDAGIASATLLIDADCLRAERALYLARQGHRAQAAEVIAQLHARYDKAPNIKISGWLNLVEGLDIYFSDMGAGAHDKVKRSHALSAAAGFKALQALSAAWLAQLDYMRHDITDMSRHLFEAFEAAAPENHGARSRASLVAAQALRHADREDLSVIWNRRAHEHATIEGDDATLSALIHNMAWLRMLMWRQKILRGQDDSAERRHVWMSAQSTDSFDEMVGSSSLLALHPLLRAQILSLQGEPKAALAVYGEHLSDAQKLNAARLQGNLLADQAWCYAQLGDIESARRYSVAAEESITSQTHVDDRAATHSRLAQIYSLLGDSGAESQHSGLALLAWKANEQFQTRVVEVIGSLHEQESTVPPSLKPPAALTPPAHTAPPPASASAP